MYECPVCGRWFKRMGICSKCKGQTPPPTPEEIRRRCFAIQEGWDEETREHRAGAYGRRDWMPPGSDADP